MPSFKEYQMMFQLSANTSAQFQSAFSGAQNQIAQLQGKIDSLNRQQGDITAYTKQQAAVEKTKAKLETLKQQYDNLKAAQDKAGGSDVDLQNKMLEKQLQIDKTSASLDQQTQKLDTMGNALDKAGIDTDNLAAESARLQAELSGLKSEQEEVADAAQESSQSFAQTAEAMQEMLAASGAIELFQNLAGNLKECTDAATQYESAMAGVKRTVGGSDSFISDLGDSFKELSTQIPISAEELAGIATTAGQLGIAQSNVEQFTTVMAQLATTTDLTADDAATMLAQFANITGTTQYDRLGSTVAELGDATATTASKVVQMSQGMAAAASQAGFSETDILAVSAAVGSLGIEAQAGSTAMSTLISTLYKATETGDKLEDFAAVAGMTANEFKQAWAEDAVGAMDAFIQGLNNVERNGKSAVVILDELGINNVRQTKAILGLASAGDLLSSTISQANAAWSSNTALAEKAGVMYDTTEAKMTMMQNAANNVKIAVGDALTPTLGDLAEAATDVMQPVSTFLANNPAIVKALTTAVGVMGAVTAGVVGLSAAMKAATVVSGMFSASLGPVFAITAAVAGLAGGAVYLSSVLGDTKESFEDLDQQFDDTLRQIEEQQQILDLCGEYRDLQKELGYTEDDLASLSHEDMGITFTATIVKNGFENESDVALIKKLADNITDDKGELKQLLEINGADVVTDDNLDKIIDLAADITTGDGALRQELAVIGVEDISDDDIATIRTLAAEITDKRGELSQTAQLIGLDNVTEDDIQLISDLSDAITTESGELKQLLQLKGADDVTDADIARIVNFAAVVDTDSGELRQKLEAIGVKDVTDADIARIQELAQNIQTNNGTLSETLALMGFENYDDILAACGLADEVKDANVSSTVSITVENVDDTVAHLNDLAGQLSTAKDELTTAQADLAALEEQFKRTENKMLATNEKDEKAAYAEKLEGLSEAIVDAKDKVSSLESTYNDLNAEYEAGNAALEEFNAKQARAAEIAEQLGIAASGAVSGITAETDALKAKLETVEAIAAANQADLRANLYENIEKQGRLAAKAAEANYEAQEQLNEALTEANYVSQFSSVKDAAEVNAIYQGLLRDFDQMTAQPGFEPFSDEAIAKAKEIQYLSDMMGESFEDLSQYADRDSNFVDWFGWVSVNNLDYFNEAIKDANAYAADLGKTASEYQDDIQHFADTLISGIEAGELDPKSAAAIAEREFGSIEHSAEAVAEVMAIVNAAFEETGDSADGMADGVEDVNAKMLELQNAVQPIVSQMAELSSAYAEAYESAKSSLDGQFELFEVAKKLSSINMSSQLVNASETNPESKASNQSMREALDSQAKWFEDYNALLQQAQQRGVNTDLLATIADGTAESVETLKRLTADSTTADDIAALNAAYATVGDAKAELAGTMADIETDYTSKMANLQAQMETTIGEMDLSSEAAAAAQATFQAMAAEANSMLPTVRAAYARIAAAAQAELNKIHMPNLNMPGSNGSTGHAASGTDSAHPGMYMVGEMGPELVMMNGGEQVFTAAETAAILASANSPVSADALSAQAVSSGGNETKVDLTVNYTINGGTSESELRSVLEKQNDNLRDLILETVREANVDSARRNYV